jgi:hypothetical protein
MAIRGWRPHPPEGKADVCFGSSVIIGPAAPPPRPYIDIHTVRVNPSTLSLDLTYRTAETARLSLFVDRFHAVAAVEVGYAAGADVPFATFRSMWVADGNADLLQPASVSIDACGLTPRSRWVLCHTPPPVSSGVLSQATA